MAKQKVKKHAKVKKTIAKTSKIKQSVLSLAEKVEKEFRQIPMKLAKLYRQEIVALKQQEKKLKADSKKAQSTQKTALKKQAGLKPAHSHKKRVTTQKQVALADKIIKEIAAKLDHVNKTKNAFLAKQMKYMALNKELTTLEKKLSVKNNKKPAKTKMKETKKSRPTDFYNKPNNSMTEELSNETPTISSSPTETVETQ